MGCMIHRYMIIGDESSNAEMGVHIIVYCHLYYNIITLHGMDHEVQHTV